MLWLAGLHVSKVQSRVSAREFACLVPLLTSMLLAQCDQNVETTKAATPWTEAWLASDVSQLDSRHCLAPNDTAEGKSGRLQDKMEQPKRLCTRVY